MNEQEQQQATYGPLFRGAELERRQRRRAHLMGLVEREAALSGEELTPQDRINHAEAIARLKRIEEAFHRETGVGYWRKLWLALKGDL